MMKRSRQEEVSFGFFVEKKFADVSIAVGVKGGCTRVYRAHKIVLSDESGVWRRRLEEDLKDEYDVEVDDDTQAIAVEVVLSTMYNRQHLPVDFKDFHRFVQVLKFAHTWDCAALTERMVCDFKKNPIEVSCDNHADLNWVMDTFDEIRPVIMKAMLDNSAELEPQFHTRCSLTWGFVHELKEEKQLLEKELDKSTRKLMRYSSLIEDVASESYGNKQLCEILKDFNKENSKEDDDDEEEEEDDEDDEDDEDNPYP
jgi:hypothetical protein